MKKMVSVLLVLVLIWAAIPALGETAAEQTNAVAMLNYLAVMSERIRSARSSRLVLNEVYDELINDLDPSQVDLETLGHVQGMMNAIQKFRTFEAKRLHAQYLLEQGQAQAIWQGASAAVKNGTVKSGGYLALGVRMADGFLTWQQADAAARLASVKTGWELDEAEQQTLHELRLSSFSYMVRISNEFNLSWNQTLNEENVRALVRMENEANPVLRIQYLETGRRIYASYGGYWLLLARSYYEVGEWEKCLEAVDAYRALDIRIFRRDHELAQVMPMAIDALNHLTSYSVGFIRKATPYLEILRENAGADDWQLHFSAALTWLDVCARTPDSRKEERWEYFDAAYEELISALPCLIQEQRRLNEVWLAPVAVMPLTEGLTAAQRAERQEYNAAMTLRRSTELAPVYEPLRLYLRLLHGMQTAAGDAFAEHAEHLDQMLHPEQSSVRSKTFKGNDIQIPQQLLSAKDSSGQLAGEVSARLGVPTGTKENVLFWNEAVEAESWFRGQPFTAFRHDVSASCTDTGWFNYVYESVTFSFPLTQIADGTEVTMAVARGTELANSDRVTDLRITSVIRADPEDPTSFRVIYSSAKLNKAVRAFRYQTRKSEMIDLAFAWRLTGTAVREGLDWGAALLNREGKYATTYSVNAVTGKSTRLSDACTARLLSKIHAPQEPAEPPMISLRKLP